MHFTEGSTGTVAFFAWLVLVVAGNVVIGVYQASRKLGGSARRDAGIVAIGILAWVGAISGAVASGAIEAEPVPRLMLLFGASNLVAVLFAASPMGSLLARGLPIATLIWFQVFRLPLEMILHLWAEAGVIPATMTWTGSNFDIVSGVLALIAAPLAARSRGVAWLFNVVGLLLLINVGRVAMLSSPLPFAWNVQPPLQLAFHLPYAWIIPVCVGGALAGHLVLTRALLLKR